MKRNITRRGFLKATSVALAGAALAACRPTKEIVEKEATKIVKETVVVNVPGEKEIVEKETTKIVKETVVVEVTPTPLTGPTNALGVILPADALPLDQQYRLISTGAIGSGLAAWGAQGHSMESMYNHAFEDGMLQEVLTALDKGNNVVPIGCESFKMSEDGMSWDFKLRKELVWSDGKPITADDWVYTLRHSLGNAYDFGWFYYDILNAADVTEGRLPPEQLGIEAVDPYTLRIHTTAPCPHLPALGVWFVLAPRQAYDQFGENWALEPDHYIASGPFKLTKFERGIRYWMELNPTYKGVLRPYFTQIRGELTPTGLPAYIAGDIREYTINMDTPAGEIGIVNANPILRAESHPQPSTSTDYIGFNTLGGEFKPLDNPDVRMALSKAIDKEALMGEIGRGFANPAWGILPPGFPGYAGDQLKTLDPNVYDVEAAKALLAKAGYADGKGFPKFEMWIRAPSPSMLILCQAIQAQWKENLGIQIELHPADYSAFTDMAFTQKKAAIYYVGYMLDYYDPSTFLGVFRTDGGRHPHQDPQYDEFYLKAVSDLDMKKRAEGLVEAEKMLVNSTAYIFLWSGFGTVLWPCNLSGWMLEPNADGYQLLGPPTAALWASVGLYWTTSTCRKGLR